MTADFRIRFPRGVRVQNPGPEFIFRIRSFRGNYVIVEIICIQRRHCPAGLQIVETCDASRFRSRLIQSRQKQPGKDGDDGNYHKELYEGKSTESARKTDSAVFPELNGKKGGFRFHK